MGILHKREVLNKGKSSDSEVVRIHRMGRAEHRHIVVKCAST